MVFFFNLYKFFYYTIGIIFIKHDTLGGQYLYEELKNNGILVRHFNKERIEDYLRVTIGTDEEMRTFINKLKKILNK